MIEGQPSQSAQGAAMQRAAHQILDRPPVFADPLALTIIGPEAAQALRSGSDWRVQPGRENLRAKIAMRSRYTEDCFAEAYARGVRQYVLLGAGLDTFAYRAAFAGVRVFEIDHPATQEWKRQRLAETGIPIPAHAVFAPVDFERETFADGLARAGFDFAAPAFFAWLGVVVYLTADTIFRTLKTIATTMPASSEIVFDFARRAEGSTQSTLRTAYADEPLLSSFVPRALVRDVRALGFAEVELATRKILHTRYFKGRDDGLVLKSGRMLRARV
jgi:methyltransferase (TIGR00027 family)